MGLSVSSNCLELSKLVFVNERVRVALSNCAHVLSSGDFEVSLISPSGSPGVLYVPEVSTILTSVASC